MVGSPKIGPDGFWFRSESEQKDLSTDEYGSTVVTPRFVISEVDQMKDLGRLTMFQEAFWWHHQDLYVIKALRIWRRASQIQRPLRSIKAARG